MNIYRKFAKLLIVIISITLILLAYYNKDTLLENMLYYNVLFNLFISLDFLFYILYDNNKYKFNHSYFVFFPILRFRILFNEILNYIKRFELILFLFSTSYFLFSFYLNNQNNSIYNILLFLIDIILQYSFLLFSLFILKNILKRNNFEKEIKNYMSYFLSITILITVFSDKTNIGKIVFYYYPFACGFFSNIVPFISGQISYLIILIFFVILTLLIKEKFKEWPI